VFFFRYNYTSNAISRYTSAKWISQPSTALSSRKAARWEMVAHPVSDMYRKYSWLMWKMSDELSITAQKITGHIVYYCCDCFYMAVCSRRRCELTASDEFEMLLCGVSETKCQFMSVSLGIHDVIHRPRTNIDLIGDKHDTLGTWKDKMSEWQLHNKHRVGRIWGWYVSEVLGEKVDLNICTID
jgi:hypothetical protein